MSREELYRIPMDLWCLGHTHVPFPAGLPSALVPTEERIFNPGTHVQTDVSCSSDGFCFLLMLDDAKHLSAASFRSGSLRFVRRHISVSGDNMEELLRLSLADIEDNAVVDLILSGAADAQDYRRRTEITDAVLTRFLEGSCQDHNLSRQIRADIIDAEFPETSFSARFLHALLEDPKEAQLAYELLCTLKEEKK